MPDMFAAQELPRKRTGRAIAWLDEQSIRRIALIGVGLYLGIVVLVSGVEFAFHLAGYDLVHNDQGSGVGNVADLLYFNLITILTVGYGDFHPTSIGKLFSVIEAFAGVGLFSLLVAVITVKALLPPRNTIVFSKYAYYCTEPQCFLIIFVNTSNTNLAIVEMSSYFKLGGDWGVKHSITSPFVTRSVQTFHIERVELEKIVLNLRDGDCLRVGIMAGVGFTSFSTSIQYHAEKILVIPNRNELVAFFEPKWHPDFNCPELREMFHYQPQKALTLRSFVEAERMSRSQNVPTAAAPDLKA
jgi:Ion channel